MLPTSEIAPLSLREKIFRRADRRAFVDEGGDLLRVFLGIFDATSTMFGGGLGCHYHPMVPEDIGDSIRIVPGRDVGPGVLEKLDDIIDRLTHDRVGMLIEEAAESLEGAR